MLLWAVFSVGYLLGVCLTLKLMSGKEREEVESISPIVLPDQITPWETFTKLTKINYTVKQTSGILPTFKPKIMVSSP